MNIGRPCQIALLVFFASSFLPSHHSPASDDLTAAQRAQVRRLEQQRIDTIEKVIGSVVAIYDEDRQGGGSGVIIDASGITLTNHHVIMGAGTQGWGGLADGNLYHWTLIGTDPGGDVAMIQLEGLESFPCSPLGNSDNVKVGDWALAMGNPFILTEDQKPTITLGIVSGVKRYQHGAGANQLVYGNCIQIDSSINPGNSGGPLFNLAGEIIGINGRGSFLERGRVNVGLGYAISSNQIKNFIPDLLATKLVEHGTIDASFTDRGGKVICSTINEDSPVALAGLSLGDELLEFEGISIENANQYTNLICTLPEDWPTQLRVRSTDGAKRVIDIRMFGLPYRKPSAPRMPGGGDKKPSPEQEKKMRRAREMFKMLAATPGEIRSMPANRMYTRLIFQRWRKTMDVPPTQVLHWKDAIVRNGQTVGHQEFWLSPTGQIRSVVVSQGTSQKFIFDGESFAGWVDDRGKALTRTEAKLNPQFIQAFATYAASGGLAFEQFGKTHLDGGGKTRGQSAFRFKVLDDEEDWFYFWLNLFDEEGAPQPVLAKAAADKDCDRDQGGIVFEEWETLGDWNFAKVRKQVRGLGENVVQTLVNERVDQLDYRKEWFEIPESFENGESRK